MAILTDYIINYTDPLKGSFIIKPYTSNGPKFPTTSVRPSSSSVSNSPLLLYGKGHPNYGERTDENLLHLTENFSGSSAPITDSSRNTLKGILWHKEILYFYDSSGTNWYQWNGSTWTDITSSVDGNTTNGHFRAFGSPPVLERYSDDEREIQSWIRVEHDTGTSNPNSSSPIQKPTRVLQINHDGTSTGWDSILDETDINTTFLRLDATNSPVTGALELSSTLQVDGRVGINNAPPTGSNWLEVTGNIVANSQFLGSDQSSSNPTYSFSSDPTTGMFLDGSNLAFSVGSFTILTIQTNGLLVTSNSTGNYEDLVTAGGDDSIPNKKFVTDAVLSGSGADTFVNGGSFGSGTLTLTYVATGSPLTSPAPLVITGLTPDNVAFATSPIFNIGSTQVFNVEEALTELDSQKASLSGDTFTGAVTFSSTASGTYPTANAHFATKEYVDDEISAISPSSVDLNQREIALGSDGPVYVLPFSSTVGNNKLLVFINGVKQYKDLIGFDEAQFLSTLTSSTVITGLPSYSVIAFTLGYPPGSPVPGSPLPGSPYAGSPIPAFWTISGDHVSNFTSGDTIRVDGNTGLGTPTSYILINSPVLNNDGDTDLPVTPVGSPGGTEAGDGSLGITYEFQVSFDDGSPFTTYYINGNDVSIFGDLITFMNTQFAGAGTSYLYSNNIRVETSGGTTGSVVLSNGVHSTTSDLFDSTNLGVDGFTGFRNNGVSVPGTVFSYNEGNIIGSPLNVGSPLGSPLGFEYAAPGSSFDTIIFNSELSSLDIVEFLLT